MKALVIYYSLTGNTRKVAEAMAAELGADLKRTGEEVDLENYNLICIGTPVYGSSCAGPVKRFLQRSARLDNKKIAAFCTMASAGDEGAFRFIRKTAEEKGASFLGGFSCLGGTSPLLFFGPKLMARDHPDERDLERCREFARGLK